MFDVVTVDAVVTVVADSGVAAGVVLLVLDALSLTFSLASKLSFSYSCCVCCGCGDCCCCCC